jgi:threonine/homoserine/homoserine lactone efflux protein
MSIVDAAAFQLVNPKAWIFALGAVTTFRLTGLDPLAGAIAVPLVMAVVIVPSASLWAGFGDVLGRLLTGERSRRIVNGVMAALVLGTVVLVWV